MIDIALRLVGENFDINLDGEDLEAEDGLETSLAISLFSDKRVNTEQMPYGATSKKGWWGDMFPDVPGDKIGSRLWTLNPAKITDETRKRAEDYCRESTKWMIDDGVADTINLETEYNENKHLINVIEVVRPDGSKPKFQVIWDAQKVRRL